MAYRHGVQVPQGGSGEGQEVGEIMVSGWDMVRVVGVVAIVVLVILD